MTSYVRDATMVLPSIKSHRDQKFLGKEQRLVNRALEINSSGFEFLLFHLTADRSWEGKG